ncbi:MAG: helix-turn-helix domain-containing protein [Acidimicrobiales bacterium]
MSQAYEQGTVPDWPLGWRMQRALSFAAISVEQMGEELGVSRSTISRWLNDRGAPSRGYLKLWALRTGVPLGWLDGTEGLPRVDSNHQPAGWRVEPVTQAELATFRRTIRQGHDRIRIAANP